MGSIRSAVHLPANPSAAHGGPRRGCSLYRPLKDRHWKNRKERRAARRRIEEQERNRGVQERVQGETEKGRASRRNKAAAIFVRERLAHRVGRGGRKRGTEGRKVVVAADDDDNVSLTWFGLPGWHRARQPRRSLIRGRQMMAGRRRVRGSEREGRKNNPALSCQLSAANEPLLPFSWAVAFRRRLFETEVTARYPPINRLILPHPRSTYTVASTVCVRWIIRLIYRRFSMHLRERVVCS